MIRYVSISLFFLLSTYSGLTFGSEISTTLIPENLISNSISKEIDWLIEDVNKPKTEFGRAIAGQLKTKGIASSVSATYQNLTNPEEIYSLEVYEFIGDFLLEETVNLLKPKLLNEAKINHSEINGYPYIEIKHGSYKPKLLAAKAGKRLVIIGMVNNMGDISVFTQKYFSWYSRHHN